jgi:hypothetical protein
MVPFPIPKEIRQMHPPRRDRDARRRLPALVSAHALLLLLVLVAPIAAHGQQVGGAERAIDLMKQLHEVRARMEMVGVSMELVEWESQYCRSPQTPNKQPDYAFLNARMRELDELRNRYRMLKRQLEDLLARNQAARTGIGDANFADPSFWRPWDDAYSNSRLAIQNKRKMLDAVPEVRCRTETEPPDPPVTDVRPPQDPGVSLPDVTVRPIETPAVPARFCSAAEKDAVLDRFYAANWDFYFNYQDAREYLDAIVRALERGEGNREELTRLLPEARSNHELHARRLDEFHKAYDRVRAMRIEDCSGQQSSSQTTPPTVGIEPPAYLPFVQPRTPDRLCTESDRAESLRSLRSARDAARINYEKATEWVVETSARIGQGDRSAEAQLAFDRASDDSARWFRAMQDLEAEIQRVEAMPISECADQPRTPDEVGFLGPAKLFVEVGGAYAQFTRYAEMSADFAGVRDSDAETEYFSPLAALGLRFPLSPGFDLEAGLRYTQGTIGSSLWFDDSSESPSRMDATVEGKFIDLYLGLSHRFGDWRGAFTGGPTFTFNDILFDSLFDDVEERTTRSHQGLIGNFGIGFYRQLWGDTEVGGRFNAVFGSTRDDADRQRQWQLLVSRGFF